MIFTLIFKTPDVSDQLSEEEFKEAEKVLDKFLKFDECVTLEFDTEFETARVMSTFGQVSLARELENESSETE